MATGYNIVLPNGSIERASASSFEQRLEICEQLIQKWKNYCLNNWMSANSKNAFSPQNKVKMFLSSLGYFLLTGVSDDANRIITRYKDVMNGKREIPASSCPDYIEDQMYGLIHSGGQDTQFAKSQTIAFEQYIKFIDENAERKYKQRPKKKKVVTAVRLNKPETFGNPIIRTSVDTDGIFVCGNTQYKLDMQHCRQYLPKILPDGDCLYDMDCIYCVQNSTSIDFYDQNYTYIDNKYVVKLP